MISPGNPASKTKIRLKPFQMSTVLEKIIAFTNFPYASLGLFRNFIRYKLSFRQKAQRHL